MVTLSLATLILIVLGGLVLVVVIWWLLKELVDKRRKQAKLNNAETGVPMTDRQNLEEKKPTTGPGRRGPTKIHGSLTSNTFARPASPAPSYKLAPGNTIIDWGQTGKGSSAPSIRSLSQQESIRNMRTSSIASPMPLRHKPSPLRPDNHRSLSASTVGGIGGAYMPPLPSPRSLRCGTPESLRPAGVSGTWVSPLDVHYSRPSTPNANSRPSSLLPRLQFPGELEQSALLVPTPNRSALNSEVASIVNNDSFSHNAPHLAKPTPSAADSSQSKAPNLSVFPQYGPPPRSARQSSRSIFPTTNEPERPASRRKPMDIDTQIPIVPVPPIPQEPSTFEPPNFDFENSPAAKWNPGTAILRDSVVSKQRVSVYKPPKTPRSREASPDMPKGRIASAHSVAASSMYSTTTSILDTPRDNAFPNPQTRIRSQSYDRRRTRSRSTSSSRLSRTQDSLRQHSRKLSQHKDAGRSPEKRNSRGRDQLYYDPRQQHRDRSGSVHGRKVDFDHPRDSPFSNAHAASEHSNNSSVSTTVSTVPSVRTSHVETIDRLATRDWEWEKVPQIPKLDLDLPSQPRAETDPARLSINPFISNGNIRISDASRNRSASEVSQSSIGDFYDAYYRQSIMAQRASIAAQAQGVNARTGAGDLMIGGGNYAGFNFNQNQVNAAQTHAGAGKRLQPLNFSRGRLASQTILEVQSPGLSPVVGNGENTFPSRI